MASIDPNELQDPNATPKDSSTGATGGPIAIPGGGGAAAAPSIGGAVAPNTGGAAGPITDAQQSGNGFTDVASYMNKNAEGAQGLGNQIAGNLTDKYNTLKGGIDTSSSQLGTDISKGYVPENQQLIADASNNSAAVAADPNKVADVKAQLGDTYGGPSAWGDFGTLQGQTATAQQNADLINKGQGGAQVLASQVEKTPTAGISALDAMILRGNQGAVSNVQEAAQPFIGVTDYLTQLNNKATNDITNAGNAASTAATNANTALQGSGADLSKQLNEQLTTNRAAAAANNAALNADIASQKLSPQDLASLGMTQDQWNILQAEVNASQTAKDYTSSNGQWGTTTKATPVNLANWNTQQNPNATMTLQNQSTVDQQAKAAALATFLGDKYTAPITSTGAPTTINNNAFNYQGVLDNTTAANKAQRIGAQAFVDALQKGADGAHANQIAQAAVDQANLWGNAGAGVGTVAGGVIGSIIPGGGTMAGAAVGGAAGNLAGRTAAVTYGDTKQTFGANQSTGSRAVGAANLAADAMSFGVIPAARAIVDVFCFHENSPISMFPTGFKAINKIELGDETLGGTVIAIKVSMTEDLHMYNGVLVTSGHAVLEDGVWIRVGESKDAIPFHGRYKVYNLVTSSHRIWIGGVMFADETELDEYEYVTMEESLKILNGNRK